MNKLKQLISFLYNPETLCIYVYIMAFGLFATPYLLRQQIINPFSDKTFLWGVDYIALFALFLFMIQNIHNKKYNIWYLFPAFSIAALLPTQSVYPISWGVIFLFCCCCILPQYILYTSFSLHDKEHCIRNFLIFFDCIISILFITAFIDKIADRVIVKQLAAFLSCDSGVVNFAYFEDSEHTRFFSLFGHPLTNAFLFNACYVLNILYNKHHKSLLPNYVWTGISLISLVCCGGKTGITVGVVITVLTYFKKWKFYLLAAFSVFIAYFSGLLDNLIYRFMHTSLTSGRATGLQNVLLDEYISFSFLRGYGSLMDTTYIDTPYWYVHVACEFPFVSHALRYGILFTLLLLLPPFIYITIRLWKQKRFIDWFFWCLLYAEINIYNGFSSCLDVSFIFYFLTFILLNITAEDHKST